MNLLEIVFSKRCTLLLLGMSLFLGGCNLFGKNGGPEEAELVLSAAAGKQVQLIVSNNFLSERQPILDPETGFTLRDTVLVVVITAETTMVSVPFERIYDIKENQQFYALIKRLDPGNDGFNAVLRVDGEIRSNQSPAANDSMVSIVYNFGNRFPEEEDVTV